MGTITFGDIYRSAQFSLQPASMELRQKTADRLLKSPTFDDYVGLVKLHLGLPEATFRDHLVGEFQTDDGTFSIVEGDRELIVLATALLAAIIKSGNEHAALALVAGSCAGKRVAVIRPDLAEWAKSLLYEFAIKGRDRDVAARTRIPLPEQRDSGAMIDSWAAAPNLATIAPLLAHINETAEADAVAGSTNATKAIDVLVDEVRDLRQELEMLWWNVGGYSKQLNKPFTDIPKVLVPILAGVELAAMTRSAVGPAGIAALILLRIRACAVPVSLTIAESVDAAVTASVTVPKDSDINSIGPLCPLLIAMNLRQTVGDGIAWHGAFKKLTGIEASDELPSLDMATQIYRELLLVKLREKK